MPDMFQRLLDLPRAKSDQFREELDRILSDDRYNRALKVRLVDALFDHYLGSREVAKRPKDAEL